MKKLMAGFILLCGMIIPMFTMSFSGTEHSVGELSALEVLGMISFIGSVAALWIWMLIDLFLRNDLKKRFLLSTILILANWPASVFYFLFSYFPRERQKLIHEKNK